MNPMLLTTSSRETRVYRGYDTRRNRICYQQLKGSDTTCFQCTCLSRTVSGGEEGLKGVTNTQGVVIMQGIVTGERCSWPTLGNVAGEEKNANNMHAVKTHPGRPRHRYGPPIEAQVVNYEGGSGVVQWQH